MTLRSLRLFRVNPLSADGALTNIEDPVPNKPDAVSRFLTEGKVFQGGNAADLHKLLLLSSGDKLLYVGDHMYAGKWVG